MIVERSLSRHGRLTKETFGSDSLSIPRLGVEQKVGPNPLPSLHRFFFRRPMTFARHLDLFTP